MVMQMNKYFVTSVTLTDIEVPVFFHKSYDNLLNL